MLRQFVLIPFKVDYKTEEEAIKAWDNNISFLLHEPDGFREINRFQLTCEQGCNIFVFLRFDGLSKQAKRVI